MVTPEVAPYARATRAGEAVAALAKALCQFEHRVTIAVPRYPGFEAGGLLVARRLTPLKLDGGAQITVFDGQLPTGPALVLFDAPGLFDRPGVYGEGADYADNAERFGMLSAAAAALIAQRAERREPFDVVHLHDFPTAAVAVVLANAEPRVPTVVTIHNGARTGVVATEELTRFGIDGAVPDSAREGGGVSLLACGVRSARAVTASSPTVASDLLDPARFGSLARTLVECPAPLTGILGGLDYAVYNPATDPLLKARYDAEDASNKGRSKAELLRSRGLDVDLSRPLVTALVEATPEGGGPLLEDSVEAILKSDVSLVVAAYGDAGLAERLEKISQDSPERFSVEPNGDEGFARRAAAASDFVLLPALYNATATWARCAQRYGALPVARARGADVDAIVDVDADLETGTGFLFDEATPSDLVGALARGLAAYGSPRFSSLRRRVMRLDLAWDRPAHRYVQVYRQAIAGIGRNG